MNLQTRDSKVQVVPFETQPNLNTWVEVKKPQASDLKRFIKDDKDSFRKGKRDKG